MKHQPPLDYGKYYHIFNRGINGEDLFIEITNYQYFLRLYSEHITPVAETFAWVLMKNHFHLLVQVSPENEIDFIKPTERNKGRIFTEQKKYNPTQQFGNLFNAYTKAFNKRYNRTGSLFESPFKRLEVNNEKYFKYLVYYIHFNPVHHGFCAKMFDYPWSSYLSILSIKQTRLNRETVIGWFNSSSEFIEFHNKEQDLQLLRTLTNE